MPRYLLPFALCTVLFATGCTTADKQMGTVREVNRDHIQAVERVAKSSGVEIVWINPPTRVRERTLEYSRTIEVERNK
ncbi:MAG: hypothetical protein ACLFSC_06570 [Wenzhouxiangella sp.]